MSEEVQTVDEEKKRSSKLWIVVVIVLIVLVLFGVCCCGGGLTAVLAPQYLRYVEKSRIQSDRQATIALIRATEEAVADPLVGPDPDTCPYVALRIDTDGSYRIEDSAGNRMTAMEQEVKKEYGRNSIDYRSNQFQTVSSYCEFVWHPEGSYWSRIEYGSVAY